MTKIIRTLTLLLLLAAANALQAQDYSPQQIENPNIADRRVYVADPAGLMSRQAKDEVNSRLAALRGQTSAEVAVCVVPSIGDLPIEDFAGDLFEKWGLGKSDKDNGVLLVIARDQRRARIQTGYGAEGALPDISCGKIIASDIAPAMKRGDIDAAVQGATSTISAVLSDPALAEELRSSQADNRSGNISALNGKVIRDFVEIIAFCAFILCFVMFFRNIRAARRRPTNFDKANIWRKNLTTLAIAGVASLGTGLIFALIALFLYRRYRDKPLRCDTCGAKMHRLGEEEDNEFLNSAQDLEERLNTVDYDVWQCDKCGTIERFPYPTKQTKYSPCPNCGTVAYHLECDKIVTPATTRHPGAGEKIYRCEYCGHHTRHPYRIPRKEDASLAAAAVLGSIASSGRGGGGGGFGGGFGGGSSGGGGASGGW